MDSPMRKVKGYMDCIKSQDLNGESEFTDDDCIEYFIGLHYADNWCNGLDRVVIRSVHSMVKMKVFYRGYVLWYQSGNNSYADAVMKARANIGNAIQDCGMLHRLKWWWVAGIKKSDTTYC